MYLEMRKFSRKMYINIYARDDYEYICCNVGSSILRNNNNVTHSCQFSRMAGENLQSLLTTPQNINIESCAHKHFLKFKGCIKKWGFLQ